MQSDPIGLDGGENSYLYANGNSLRLIDAYGLWLSEDELNLMKQQQSAKASAYEKAFGDNAHSYMMDNPTVANAIGFIAGLGFDIVSGKAEMEALGLLGKMTLSEAKSLVSRWEKRFI